MRTVRGLRPDALPNLLSDGCFDFGGLVWSFPDSQPEVLDVKQTEPDGASRVAQVSLATFSSFRMIQSFLHKATMDFPSPTGPLQRDGLTGGYQSDFKTLIGASRGVTAGISLSVLSGSVRVVVDYLDRGGASIAQAVLTEGADATETMSWRRLSAPSKLATPPASIQLTFSRVTPELCRFQLSKVQLTSGRYSEAPYTGDLMHRAIPPGTVIMVMGTACPPGFKPLASSAASELWAIHGIETKKGAFPTGSDTGDGSAVGDPTHNKSSYDFRLEKNDVLRLESFNSTFGQATTGSVSHNPFVESPADVPNESGEADHQHNVEEGGSIPVNRQFLFCERGQ